MTKNDDRIVESATLDEAIDDIGFRRMHVLMFITVGMFFATDSIQSGCISYVTEVLRKPWVLEAQDESWIQGLVFAGQIITAPLWGGLADRYGRRPTFLAASFTMAMAGTLTAVAQNKIQLMILRFFMGAAMAGYPVGFTIFAEILPTTNRGKIMLSTMFGFAAGSLYQTIMAMLSICSIGWRAFVVLCTFPTWIGAFMSIFFLSESAFWLVSVGRCDEAVRNINLFSRRSGSTVQFRHITTTPGVEKQAQGKASTMTLLKEKELRRPFILMSLVWFGFGLAFYGLFLMTPHLFSKDQDDSMQPRGAEMAGSLSSSHCAGITFQFQDILRSNLGQSFGLLLSVCLVDRVGRRGMQQILYLTASIAVLCLSFKDCFGVSLLQGLIAIAIGALMGASCCTWPHTSESFPTHVRAIAGTICSGLSRAGAAISTFAIAGNMSFGSIAAVLCACCFVSFLAVSFTKETAGLTLDGKEATVTVGKRQQEPRTVAEAV